MRAIGGGYRSSCDVPYIPVMDDPGSTEIDAICIGPDIFCDSSLRNYATTYTTNFQHMTHLVLPSLTESAYSPSEVSTEDSIDSNSSFGELSYQRPETHRRSSFTILSSSDDISIHSPSLVRDHVISPSTYDQTTASAVVHANENSRCNQVMGPGIQDFGVLDSTLSLSRTFSDSAALVPQRYSSDGCQRGYAVKFTGDPAITAPHWSSRYQDWQEAESHRANVWNQNSSYQTPGHIRLREQAINSEKWILDALSELGLHSPPVTPSQPFRPVGTFAGTQASKERRNITRGDKTFECRVNGCGRDFTTRHNLKHHMDAHRGIKPHACPACGKKFTTKSTMIRHKYNIHKGG